MKRVLDFLRDEEGASALEYGVMIATIMAVIVAVVISIGTKTNATFGKVDNVMAKPPFR